MITEIAEIEVKPGTEGKLIAGVESCKPIFARAPGFRGLELHHSIEHPQNFVLQVKWDPWRTTWSNSKNRPTSPSLQLAWANTWLANPSYNTPIPWLPSKLIFYGRPRPRKSRVSTDQGLEQDFNSLDAQREASEAYIKSQAHEGWRLICDRYDDGGFSGGSMVRPALQKLLIDVQVRGIDVIVVYKVDRLTRSLADFAKLVETFDAHGVSFVSVTQSFNTTTSMGRLTLKATRRSGDVDTGTTSTADPPGPQGGCGVCHSCPGNRARTAGGRRGARRRGSSRGSARNADRPSHV